MSAPGEPGLAASDEGRGRAVAEALAAWGDRHAVHQLEASEVGFDQDLVRSLAGRGWFRLAPGSETRPPPASGWERASTVTELVVALAAIGAHPLPGPFQSSLVQAAGVLYRAGALDLADTVAAAQVWAAWCGDGVAVTAEATGAGWVLSGRAPLIPFGAAVGLFVVPIGGRGPAGEDPSAVLAVPADSPGVEVRRQPSLGREATATVIFDRVVVARAAGFPLDPGELVPPLDIALVAQAAELIGTAQGALRLAGAWVAARRQWGKPLAELQTIRHRLVDLRLAVEAAWLATVDAAGRADLGLGYSAPASAAKVLAVEAALAATAGAHQLHGGEGYYEERDLGLFSRRARALAPRLGGVDAHLERVAALGNRFQPPK